MTTQTQETPTNGSTPKVSHVKAQFQAMLAPTSKAVSRKAWGIDVSTIWLPYFTAAKTVGAVDDVDLPDTALGAPFRLRRDKDTNEVKFSQSGRPLFSVAPELNALVNRARDNYISGLIQQTAAVREENPEAFSAQVDHQIRAGTPIVETDQQDLNDAILMAQLKAQAEAEPTPVATIKRTRKTS